MKTTILVLLSFILLLPVLQLAAQAQPYATEYTSVASLPVTGPGVGNPLKSVFSSREQWELSYLTTLTDINVDGVVDTSNGNTTYYIGHIIPTHQLSQLPTFAAAGRDSATIVIKYRHVAIVGNRLTVVGPWINIDTLTFTNRRSAVSGAGGGVDSLVVASPFADVNTSFMANTTGYMQTAYDIANTRANVAGGTADAWGRPSATENYSWKGSLLIIPRRNTR
ncbi:MAG: hypothetical protein IH600_15080 [Bacteroidetes bacterium]|nr:hypothetical protein [Bacteroidota bacterium]